MKPGEIDVLSVTLAEKWTPPTEPSEMDLRFFSEIVLTDTFDGKGAPSDGVSYRAILYGNKVVWQRAKVYGNSAGGPSQQFGNIIYEKVARVAFTYLDILAACRKEYFKDGFFEQKAKVKEEFFITEEDLKILQNHPQYQQMVESFGLSLVPEGTVGICYRISLSKHHREN